MKIQSTLLTLALAFSLFGQDVTSYGGNFFPIKKTNISIEKEVLSFTVRDDIAYVDIQFEFHNPSSKDQKIGIEFEAPAQFSNPLQIKNFTLVQEGKIIPYQLKARECEECELKDPGYYNDFYGEYIFRFEITFKPGLNRIHHSFNFPRSGDMDVHATYNYKLATGENWAGGKIKDLTVNIDMGPNQYFFVNDAFGETAEWSIIGTGKVTDESPSFEEEIPSKFVRILSGQLQIKATNLLPERGLDFGTFSEYLFTNYIGGYYSEEALILEEDDNYKEDFTKADLRILRNTVYAQHGYVFNSADLQKHFNQFAWYMPNPNIKMEDIILSKKEVKFVERLKALERE